MTPTELSMLATLTATAQLHSSTAQLACPALPPPPSLPLAQVQMSSTLAFVRLPAAGHNCAGNPAAHLISSSLSPVKTWLFRAVAAVVAAVAAADQLRHAQFNLPAAVARYASRAAFRWGSCVAQLPLTFVQPGGLSCKCFVLLAHSNWQFVTNYSLRPLQIFKKNC